MVLEEALIDGEGGIGSLPAMFYLVAIPRPILVEESNSEFGEEVVFRSA